MPSQSSQNAMSQSNLAFGASKASAAANKAKQAGGTAAPSPPAPTPTEPGLPTAAEAQTEEKKSDAKGDATLPASTSSTSQEGKETAGNKEQNKWEETIEKRTAKENDIETVSQPKDQDVTLAVAKDVKEESGAKEELGAAEENKVVEGKAKDAGALFFTASSVAARTNRFRLIPVQTTEDPIDPIEAMLRVFDL